MGRDIIAIGASAGGFEAVLALLRDLPDDLPAAVFVVIHVGPESAGFLPQILNHRTRFAASHAIDGQRIERGHIYCAPPDHHLMISDHSVCVMHGPKENGFRPAIDALFRSAAASYGGRVIGVVLSGALDDGVYGLMQIKEQGGIALVQSPEEAAVGALPLAAIKYVDVDHIAPIETIAALIPRLVREGSVPEGVKKMGANDRHKASVNDSVHAILEASEPDRAPSAFVCPECGGALWERQNGELVRYRCHVGHTFTAKSLLQQQDSHLEAVLWTALRAIDESIALRKRMAERATQGNLHALAAAFESRAKEDNARAELLRQFLLHREQQSSNPRRSKTTKRARGNGNHHKRTKRVKK
jgi:two-component system chemotaxis response regulator CheB